ncbi:MAG TPA: FAD-dependent oxidoreductase [Thermodesulfobacteriota bacterium]|nr:FAD-dependent oxidoreductase [Thermodesulfobacteriota bacterium]
MEPFRNLFQPIRIGKMELKNRIVMLAMTTGYGESDETVSDRLVNFFAERAKGGAGFIIVPFSPVRAGSPVEPGLYEDRFIPGATRLTERIHAFGAKIASQLITSYHVILGSGIPEVVGPSPVVNLMMRCTPRPLTVDEIHGIVEEYAKSARRVREAGFDAVEILVGAGYLLNRFLSPVSNKRQDQYGGSLENRMRITLEIIASVRKAVGEGFPISVRLNVEEQMGGGHTIEDSKGVAQILEKAGIQVINMYTGWHESPVPTVQPSLPKGAFAHLAEKIKSGVRIPVVATNRINDPWVAEKILAEGKADLIGMGRALLADPEFPKKAREGRVEEIIPCIACSNCLTEVMGAYRQWGKPVATFCTVNPVAGKEGHYIPHPAPKPKKVMVIGGGPAGLEAATIAAMRGHRVTLYDRGEELGGRLLLAAIPPYKSEMKALAQSLSARARKAGVRIKLHSEPGRESIQEEKPDALVLALGSTPRLPDIPGSRGQNVVFAEEVLAGSKSVSGSVLVVGGGVVGCETAEFLIEQGKGVTQVTVLEMLDRMANDMSPTYRPFFLARLKRAGIKMMTGARVEEITEKGVRVKQGDGSTWVEGNAVVLAGGSMANRQLVQELEGIVPEVHVAGDCISPRMVKEAMEEGFLAGWKI